MNYTKLAQRTLLAGLISTVVGLSLSAKTIDVSSAIKDIKVMSRILETSLETSAKNFPGRPRIEGLYLASQGYLFTIQLNGISSFGFPGIAAWDNGRLELDLPELIHGAFANADIAGEISEAFESVGVPNSDSVVDSFARRFENEELSEALSELREKQRELRRESYKLRREIRKVDDEDTKKRAQLENKLDQNRTLLEDYSEQYTDSLNSYKTKRTEIKVAKSTQATDAIFSTFCDYGSALKALKKNEKVTLIVKGGLGTDGRKATQVYIINQSAVKNCSSNEKLKKGALHYSL